MKITEVSPQKNNSLRVNVYVDGNYSFAFDAAEAVLKGIKEGTELSQKDIDNLLLDSKFSKARDTALNILSRKSITSFELSQKLAEKGYEPIVIGEVTEELASLGYIDDEAYASMYLEYCIEKIWGKKKIKYEMKLKGISDEIIQEVLSSYNEAYVLEQMTELILQKYSNLCLSDQKDKAKIIRYFAARGFDFSLINTAISKAAEEMNNE